eukprot:477120_1
MWSSILAFVVIFKLMTVPRSLLAADIANRPPIIMIPGFASSRLQSWSTVNCGTMQLNPRSPVWLDIMTVVTARSCWIMCMSLDPMTSGDNPQCKLRPDEGVDAIAELCPGIITGMLSAVWKDVMNEFTSRFGYTPLDMIAVPYDWRLAPMLLQKRDQYFLRLKYTIELAHESWKLRTGLTG